MEFVRLFPFVLTHHVIRLTLKLATLRELWRSFRISQATSKWLPGTLKTIRKLYPGSPGRSKIWTSSPIRFSLTEQSLTQITLGLLILSTEKEERNLLTSRSFTNSKINIYLRFWKEHNSLVGSRFRLLTTHQRKKLPGRLSSTTWRDFTRLTPAMSTTMCSLSWRRTADTMRMKCPSSRGFLTSWKVMDNLSAPV